MQEMTLEVFSWFYDAGSAEKAWLWIYLAGRPRATSEVALRAKSGPSRGASGSFRRVRSRFVALQGVPDGANMVRELPKSSFFTSLR